MTEQRAGAGAPVGPGGPGQMQGAAAAQGLPPSRSAGTSGDKAELDRLAAERLAAVQKGLEARFRRRRRGMPPPDPSQHPVNQMLLDKAPLGSRIADRVTDFLGSWTVHHHPDRHRRRSGSLGQRLYLLFHFDPYPFIFLNLAFSTQAAYAAPFILLASNRASVRDRLTLEHAAPKPTSRSDRTRSRCWG